MTSSTPIRIVIVGRPNVGKSTLFNRLYGRRRALVHDQPGVTRDRLEEETRWWAKGRTVPIRLVDTGGLGPGEFAAEIARQVQIAVSSADVVLALFDAQSGLTPADQEVILQLKKAGLLRQERPLVLGVVNKVDAESHELAFAEFYESGLAEILTVSAEHGRGIDDLKHRITEAFPDVQIPDETPEAEEQRIPKLAIVGRPNTGKSTLVNAILAEERMITSPVAGTTVDAVDTPAEINGKKILLIDTAGIRRKSKTNQGVEVLSVVQARKALDRCDVALLMLDGETGITEQDEKIGGLIEDVGCSVILGVNKWDTQRRNRKFTKETAAEAVRAKMAYLKYAPILFLSAKRGQGFEGLGDLVQEILEQRQLKISTHEFTEWVRQEVPIHNPMGAKFFLCHQAGRNPPTFVCHVNDPDKVHFSLKRHLINGIRERWGFMGSPVRLVFVAGKSAKKD